MTKSEADQGTRDDTAVNGVRLVCRDLPTTKGPKSLVGPWGTWDKISACQKMFYYVAAVQVLVEKPCGTGCDDTALNAMRVRCRNKAGQMLPETQYHSKTSWGEWSQWYSCPEGTAVTGIRTRVERRGGDDTALNAVRLRCSSL
eukprot:m51a1_g12112 hypothetical protein (144) ;mRNA; f:331-762